MMIGETIRVAFASIRANKLRAGLTMLGIIIGVGAVIAMVSVGAGAKGVGLEVELSPSLLPVLVPLLTRLRRLLDLDADPAIVREHLRRDRLLAALIKRRPGIRVPGAMEGFDAALRAVLGQQVSVRAASTLSGRLTELLGEPLPAELAIEQVTRLPVTAARLADAGDTAVAAIGLPRTRARTAIALARAVAEHKIDLAPGAEIARTRVALLEIPGIGEWTAEYILLRAVRWPDAFPAGDLGLRKAAGGVSAAALRRQAEPWRPWRSYAAAHLWQSLQD